MDVELGENLEIDGLVKTAEIYARVAMEVCGVVMTSYTPAARPAGARGRRRRRPSRRPRAARPDAPVVAGRRERPRLRRDLRLSALGQAGRAAARGLGRDAGRARLHAAVVRVPRPLPRPRRRRSPGSRRSRSTTSSSSRSGTGCRSRSSPTPSGSSAPRCACRRSRSLGLTLYKRLTLVAENARIVKVFYPVFPPDANAGDVLAWLRAR